MMLNWNFLARVGGYKTRNLPWGEYFLINLLVIFLLPTDTHVSRAEQSDEDSDSQSPDNLHDVS